MSEIDPNPTMNPERKAGTMFGGATPKSRLMAAQVLALLFVALTCCFIWAGTARADFSVVTAEATLTEAGGAPATQAGAHPDLTTTFVFGTKESAVGPAPDGSVHEIKVDLPPGLVGNPMAVPRCPREEFSANRGTTNAPCQPSAQVGVVRAKASGAGQQVEQQVPVYNMVPSPGVPAEMAFNFDGMAFHLPTTVNPDGSLTSTIVMPALAAVFETTLTLWGVPGASEHDPQRGQTCLAGECNGGGASGVGTTPFFTSPADCTEADPAITMDIDSWENIGDFTHLVEPVGPWTGCGKLAFEPKLEAMPESTQAGAPSGYNFRLDVRQDEGADGLGTPALRSSRVALPPGLTLSPSSADGLTSCSDAQLGLGTDEPPTCPAASTLGSIELETPLLPNPMTGEIYLRPQTPLDLARIALVVHGSDVLLKIPGVVHPDPATGQLVATFEDAPPQPFSTMTLHFDGGQRAALVNPSTCGEKPVHTDFSSWAGPAPAWDSSFTIDGSCGTSSQFDPSLEAGTTSPAAGASSPFILRVTRPDGEQNIQRIEATLPEGLLAKLKGVAVCGDAEAATGNCPATSQVGSTIVGVGAGTTPLYVPQPGKSATAVYLAGPYNGAPYSLVVKVPAQAGPFDLGTVTVRSALYIDPVTTQVTVKSDPLPQILSGVPISYRDIRVNVDRPDFTINPTSCDPKTIESRLVSDLGAVATPSAPFQAAGCEGLGFQPELKLQLKGATKRAGHPALKAVVTYPKNGAYANIARAQVGLPPSEFLDQGNLDKVCTRPELQSDTCPSTSVYGHAKAWTPLLERPLEGPVYLAVGFGYKLPALVADLNGQVRLLLKGKVDTTKQHGLRNTFEAVPDAPVSKFILEMKGGKKYGLLENSENICKKPQHAVARFTAQNGSVEQSKPKLVNQCGKADKKSSKG